MRILHVTQRYWPAIGGGEIHADELSARLAADGHQVTVATTDALDFELFWDPRRRRVSEPEARHRDVRILRFPVRHVPLSGIAYPALRRLLWLLSGTRVAPLSVMLRIARFTPWVPGLWRWLDTCDEPFDLVAAMTICFEPLFEASRRFAVRRQIPFVTYPLTHLGAGPRPGEDALSRFYTMRHQVSLVKASDAIVAQTKSEQDFYATRGFPKERIIVAGPGVNPDQIQGGASEAFRRKHGLQGPVVASLSVMNYDKGTRHLIDAVRRLWRAGRAVDLVLAGSITAAFQSHLDSLPAADRKRIRTLGPIDETEKNDLLAAADIFAMPSRTDSFGIVYLEAWLYRTPVIGARTWGVNDVIEDGRDGLLVPFGDVTALADAIARLLDDPARRHTMGACGEQKVRQMHTWDKKYLLVSELYGRLVHEGKRPIEG